MRFTFQELKNPTKEDLSFFYDSEEYIVPAGGVLQVPDFVARHGAKKLADREWDDVLDIAGKKNMEKSFLGVNELAPDEKVEKKSLKQQIQEQRARMKEDKEFEDLEKLNSVEESEVDKLKAELEALPDKRTKEAKELKERIEALA